MLIIITCLAFFNCEKEPSAHNEEFFDPQKLPLLSLTEVGNFWGDDSLKHTSDFIDSYFNDYSEFLEGVQYSGDKNNIAVSVFKSQVDAIEAMELRKNNIATVVVEGEKHDLIKGKWWLAKSPANAVFLNQWNTIIETAYYYPAYEEVPNILIETAAEIASRIDSLSK
ncbi:MAG: hypothetical protein ACOY90_13290 [Candidatus Zhuqueibacterota bacterium]